MSSQMNVRNSVIGKLWMLKKDSKDGGKNLDFACIICNRKPPSYNMIEKPANR